MGNLKTLTILAFGFWLVSFGVALGRPDAFYSYSPTFWFDVTYGLSSTYKSKMVLSNDTGSSITYSLGGYGGEANDLGFAIKKFSDSIAFELNDSAIATSFQDSILKYRMAFFYVGVVFSQIEMIANKEGTDLVDSAGSGMGGNLGIILPIGRIGAFFLDVTSVTYSKTRNELTSEVNTGARMDIDLGTSFDITRNLIDFLMGYRQRTLAITIDESYSELSMSTYLGLRFAFFF